MLNQRQIPIRKFKLCSTIVDVDREVDDIVGLEV